jgi:hypothetical protein
MYLTVIKRHVDGNTSRKNACTSAPALVGRSKVELTVYKPCFPYTIQFISVQFKSIQFNLF